MGGLVLEGKLAVGFDLAADGIPLLSVVHGAELLAAAALNEGDFIGAGADKLALLRAVGVDVLDGVGIVLGGDGGVGGRHREGSLAGGVGIEVDGLVGVVADGGAAAVGDAVGIMFGGSAQGDVFTLHVVIGAVDGHLVGSCCGGCHAVGQGKGADDAHLSAAVAGVAVGLIIDVGPTAGGLVVSVAHVEGAGEGVLVFGEDEDFIAERGRRGGEDVHGGEGGAVVEGLLVDGGHAGGDGDGGDVGVLFERLRHDGDGAVLDGDVAADTLAAEGHMAEIDDGGAGLSVGLPLRIEEGIVDEVGHVVAAGDVGEVGTATKGIIANVGDAVADADGLDVAPIVLPWLFVGAVVVFHRPAAGDAEGARGVVVEPRGVRAVGAAVTGWVGPLSIEVDRRAVGSGEVADAFAVGVGGSRAVCLGVPTIEDVARAGEGR